MLTSYTEGTWNPKSLETTDAENLCDSMGSHSMAPQIQDPILAFFISRWLFWETLDSINSEAVLWQIYYVGEVNGQGVQTGFSWYPFSTLERLEDSDAQIRRMTLSGCRLENLICITRQLPSCAPTAISLPQPKPIPRASPVPLFSCTMFGHLCPAYEVCTLCLVPKFLQVPL